jgi:hypothetical protein
MPIKEVRSPIDDLPAARPLPGSRLPLSPGASASPSCGGKRPDPMRDGGPATRPGPVGKTGTLGKDEIG